ncbi:LytTR family two component transcriptional regulator [Mucilaginibacter yixingensis]|uniref:LytTR family two component transcriptional regulator n=1 Tax=Mucilaginibacter yixingensis TaxID=1295612 RepID=A0A2T5J956_9SPHI|nr:LytTR family DNA-binding domain-containing protein [Mucilaginibacter yixingensis]PTQ96608.1 LytTR family two component transcriptional regulator [Mucilaginibacter yixingensis]
MTCIIVDDEPLAREAIQLLVAQTPGLELAGSFGSTNAAGKFLVEHPVDLVFLDIQMPGLNGIEFSRIVPPETLIIFTTAYAEYAVDGFEADAIDYLLKPVKSGRFQMAVQKAQAYADLLRQAQPAAIELMPESYFFVKADRRYLKIHFDDIRYIEGLKDYVVLQTADQKVITAMNIKTIHEQLPRQLFVRISKSYIINVRHIDSFDNNTVMIGDTEIPIGSAYRKYFFDEFVARRIISR